MRMRKSLVAVLAVLVWTWAPSGAQGAFGLQGTDLSFRNADGSVATEAGSHPGSITTSVGVTTRIEGGGELPEGEVKNLSIALPPGFVGARSAVPFCPRADFSNRHEGRAGCPNSTAVGLAALKVEFHALPLGSGNVHLHVPVYNLAPQPGVPAELGFVALNEPIVIQVKVSDEAPYHLVAETTNIPQALFFYDAQITIWGNPASSSHDSLRGTCLSKDVTEFTEAPVSTGSCPVDTPEKAFLTLPRSCTGPLASLFSVTPWELPQTPVFETVVTHDDSSPPQPIGMSGCGSLGFSPEAGAAVSSSSTRSPTGLSFTLRMEDEGILSPQGTAESDVRKAVVTLPEGFTVNPSAAEGLGACTVQQLAEESLDTRGCPESSKLGTVEVKTPLLEGETLTGVVYQAEPDDPSTTTPGAENPFDTLIVLYVVVKDPENGVLLKLPGKVDLDPATGRLVSTFDELPQFPFSSFTLRFREGPRAPLVTPASCGTYNADASLTPWARSGESVKASASLDVTSGCPSGAQPFEPSFSAGTVNNNAGSYAPFVIRLTRQDQEQAITGLSTRLPQGLVGKLAGVAQCPEEAIQAARVKTGLEEQAHPSCPPASQIGHVLAGAGVGPSLTFVGGTVYLGGPFRGDPLSAVVITPGVAGPFDIGDVVVRVGLNLDSTTGEVVVQAFEPFPRILKGIPVNLRDVRVQLDRPEFTLNATGCDPEQISGAISAAPNDSFGPAAESVHNVADRYQAANCSLLGFKPKLGLKLKGGTKRGDHPALSSVVIARPGDANLNKVIVTLPRSELIDNAHIRNPCTRVQFNEERCPPGSVLGTVRTFTPLLDTPLEGKVYFRSNGGERLLPDVVADLRGQFHLVQVGFVKSVHAKIRTTFASVPDAPVSKIVLNLYGGKKGLLQNNRDLCTRKLYFGVEMVGHNGKSRKQRNVLRTSCGNGSKRHG